MPNTFNFFKKPFYLHELILRIFAYPIRSNIRFHAAFSCRKSPSIHQIERIASAVVSCIELVFYCKFYDLLLKKQTNYDTDSFIAYFFLTENLLRAVPCEITLVTQQMQLTTDRNSAAHSRQPIRVIEGSVVNLP